MPILTAKFNAKNAKDAKNIMDRESLELIGKQVVDAAFEVHRLLGPGLLESAYALALCHELTLRGIRFEREKMLPVIYKGVKLDCGFRIDLVVEDEILLELKSVDGLIPVHEAQLVNYLRLAAKNLGFLINFNVALFKNGIKRKVVRLENETQRPRDFHL